VSLSGRPNPPQLDPAPEKVFLEAAEMAIHAPENELGVAGAERRDGVELVADRCVHVSVGHRIQRANGGEVAKHVREKPRERTVARERREAEVETDVELDEVLGRIARLLESSRELIELVEVHLRSSLGREERTGRLDGSPRLEELTDLLETEPRPLGQELGRDYERADKHAAPIAATDVDDPRAPQEVDRLADNRSRDTEALRELAVSRQSSPRRGGAGTDTVDQRAHHRVRGSRQIERRKRSGLRNRRISNRADECILGRVSVVSVPAPTRAELVALENIERRLLWLATRIVDYANRERPKDDELKVGGHQASSASMISLMTALYFWDLRAEDLVSVKPHASPVLHAVEYLLGRLDRRYLTTLRAYGGLQSYPSRTKDPFPVDYSTGSVGIGSAAPLFGALANRYVDAHFGAGTKGRYISLLGDAELDEGNLWEALLEPQTRGLGNALWIVDLNRQSLDRVVPVIKAHELESQFEAAGWQVLELKYGRRLHEAYAKPGGEILRRRIDEMPNPLYQSLFGASDEVVVEALLRGLDDREHSELARLLGEYRGEVGQLIQDLGGHDIAAVIDALARARAEPDRPTILFAYTIKGWGLPIAGRPLNHSALLTAEQIDELRAEVGLMSADEWDRFDQESPEGRLCATARSRLERHEAPLPRAIPVPASLSSGAPAKVATQEMVGRILLALSRVGGLAERIVTVSPDVSVSTNLGGWINKVGVFGLEEEPHYTEAEPSPLRWRVSPTGRHIELGISEMNLFLAIGQLGMTREYQGEQLFPIGTVYDPFVCRGLDAFIYGLYTGSRFVVLGTPSGISLSREGGAHQSTVTAGLGMELPGLVYAEPTYGLELEWLLLDAIRRMQEPEGEALYLRLSTKPIDQEPFTALVKARGEDAVRADVLAGGFWLRAPEAYQDAVILATCGAMTPEVLAAAELLAADEGIVAGVLCLSTPSRLYREWRVKRLTHLRDLAATREPSHLDRLVPHDLRRLPIVTVIDGASHALAFLGSCLGSRVIPLGVDAFGQVGSLADVYEAYDLSPEAIATAALIALEP
jgi:pyruvate dehydrogenase E1 component